MPHDVQWNDIDHMDNKRDFTLDPARFAPAEMAAFVEDLHRNGQRYVMIVDPGVCVFVCVRARTRVYACVHLCLCNPQPKSNVTSCNDPPSPNTQPQTPTPPKHTRTNPKP
jgi:hypothetical protein